jgi:hypothetical protein
MIKITKTLSISVLLISTSMLFNSCAKKGCTDSNANNYTEDATKDDASCTYTGSLVIWWGKTLTDSAQAYGVSSIKVYTDGTFLSTNPTSTYWSGAPTCGANGSVTYKKDLGKNKTGSVSIGLKDENGNSLGSAETQTLTGGECVSLEIPW